jgi:hypothetical protein
LIRTHEPSGEPERRIGSVLKSAVPGRRRITAVVHRKRPQFPAVGRRGGPRRRIVIRFRVVDCFDELTSVTRLRPSRAFFLLTSDRRRSASVSENLNVALLDQCISTVVRHPFRITNPGTQTPGSKNPGSKNPGLPGPGIASKPATSPGTQCLPGVPVTCPHSIPTRMLAKFRGAR